MKKRNLLLVLINTILIFLLAIGISGTPQSMAQAHVIDFKDIPERNPTFSPPTENLSAEAINPASANDLAVAMGIPSGDLTSASLMGSDPDGVGVSNSSLGTWFPTQ